jgi:hypothetical protein
MSSDEGVRMQSIYMELWLILRVLIRAVHVLFKIVRGRVGLPLFSQ